MNDYFDSTYIAIKYKIAASLIDREKEHRLTYYIALSQVIKFSNLEIKGTEGISKNRLCGKIPKYSKIEKLFSEEERLCKIE